MRLAEWHRANPIWSRSGRCSAYQVRSVMSLPGCEWLHAASKAAWHLGFIWRIRRSISGYLVSSLDLRWILNIFYSNAEALDSGSLFRWSEQKLEVELEKRSAETIRALVKIQYNGWSRNTLRRAASSSSVRELPECSECATCDDLYGKTVPGFNCPDCENTVEAFPRKWQPVKKLDISEEQFLTAKTLPKMSSWQSAVDSHKDHQFAWKQTAKFWPNQKQLGNSPGQLIKIFSQSTCVGHTGFRWLSIIS